MHLPGHRSLVLGNLIVCHTVEGILLVGRLVHLCIVLVVTLDDALGGGPHQHHMIASLGHWAVLDAVRFVPCDALQNVRLRSGRDQICPPVLLDLLLESLELLGIRSCGHELQGRVDAYRVRRVRGRVVRYPLMMGKERKDTIQKQLATTVGLKARIFGWMCKFMFPIEILYSKISIDCRLLGICVLNIAVLRLIMICMPWLMSLSL